MAGRLVLVLLWVLVAILSVYGFRFGPTVLYVQLIGLAAAIPVVFLVSLWHFVTKGTKTKHPNPAPKVLAIILPVFLLIATLAGIFVVMRPSM